MNTIDERIIEVERETKRLLAQLELDVSNAKRRFEKGLYVDDIFGYSVDLYKKRITQLILLKDLKREMEV